MLQYTHKQLSTLKKLAKHGSIACPDTSSSEYELLHSFELDGLVNIDREEKTVMNIHQQFINISGQPKTVCITPKGIGFLSATRREFCFWLIPNILSTLAIIISIIALV